jgi:hypothetical protein
MSADTMSQRRNALRGMRRSPSPQRAPAAGGAPPVNVDEKRTALQTLRSQKGVAPGVQPQAPVTPARGSPANNAPPSGRSDVQQVRPGSENLTGPTAPAPLKGVTGAVPPPRPTIAPKPPINLRGQADEQAAIDVKQSNLDRIKANEDNRAAQEGQDVTRRGGDPVLGAGQDAQDGHLDGEDTFNPFDIEDVRRQQAEDERLLNQQWLDRIASARADAENRAALGGFGLSGAAAGLVNDTETKGARERGEAISDLRAGQRGELTQAIIDRANLIDAEDALGEDIDKDGTQGTTPKGENPEAIDDVIARLNTVDYNTGVFGGDEDTEGGIGTFQEPYAIGPEEKAQLEAAGLKLTDKGWAPGYEGKLRIYADGKGRFFIIFQGA